MSLWTAALIVFAMNVPFGYWRARSRRFSRQWLLAIHLPVPAIIGLRIFPGLGFQFITFPILIGAFFFGQTAGAFLEWAWNLI